MCLLQTWYGLSDYEVEDSINDRISFSYFCGLNIDQACPNHSTLSRIRKLMTKSAAYEPLFKKINNQLVRTQNHCKKRAIVDASIIDTPLRPKGKAKLKVAKDRTDEKEVKVKKSIPKV